MGTHSPKKAFTLIELLLYVSLSAIIILAVSVLFSFLLQSRVKNQTIAEVEQESLQVLQLITQTIRNATRVNSLLPGGTASSLSVNVPDLAKNPTVFDLSGGIIRVTEGGAPPIPLTMSRLIVSSLAFQNLAQPTTSSTIRIQFTATYVNPNLKNEYEYAKIFYASATLRQ